MKQEFLLTTETPDRMNGVQTKGHAHDVLNNGGATSSHAFSSAYSEQLDKLDKSKNSSLSSSADAPNVNPVTEKKAEINVAKDGNILPDEKSKMTQIVLEQLIHEHPELDRDDVKETLAPLIDKLVATLVDDGELALESTAVAGKDLGDSDIINQTISFIEPIIAAGQLVVATEVDIAKLTNANAGKAAESSAGNGLTGIANKIEVIPPNSLPQQTLKNNPTGENSENIRPGLLQSTLVHSVIAQLRAIFANEHSNMADKKNGAGEPVSRLVKTVRPELTMLAEDQKQPSLLKMKESQNKGLLDSEQQNDGAIKLRPDILEALARKQEQRRDVSARDLSPEQVSNNKLVKLDTQEIEKVGQWLESTKRGQAEIVSASTKPVTVRDFTIPTVNTTVLTGTTATSTASAMKSEIAMPLMDIQPTLHSKAWGQVVSSRVIWMAREGVQHARLQLNPASLGSVEVRVNVHHDQANIHFIAHSSATRDAIEQALPRLRESLTENGLELTNADVSQQAFEQEGSDDEQHDLDNGEHNTSQISVTNEVAEEDMVLNELEQRPQQAGVSIYA